MPSLIGRCGGGGGGGADLPWAQMVHNSTNFADTGFFYSFVSMDPGSLATNDASVFEERTSGGTTGIRCKTEGMFMVYATAEAQANAAPAAGSFLRVISTGGTFGQEFDDSRIGGWFLTDPGSPLWEAGVTHGFGAIIITPGGPPPQDFFARVGQNSGGVVLLRVWLTIVRVSLTTN